MEWTTMLDARESVGGTEWYIVEYEHDKPMEVIKKSLDYLHSLGR